jgi:DnaK suppressor protein
LVQAFLQYVAQREQGEQALPKTPWAECMSGQTRSLLSTAGTLRKSLQINGKNDHNPATAKAPVKARQGRKASSKSNGNHTATASIAKAAVRAPASKVSGKVAAAKAKVAAPRVSGKLPQAGRESPAPQTGASHAPVTKANGKRVVKPKPKASGRKAAAVLPSDYRPLESEPFMGDMQRLYFRQKLINWREEILRSTRETLQTLHDESSHFADLADRATSESDKALELRARDRQRKLVAKIDAALDRIESGSYGYCEETGEPISLKRLDARPIATLSIEAQERHERRERVYRED